jgi:hypothetical protein
MARLSEAQRRALLAVGAGRVRHQHPFTWVIDLVDLDTVRPRTLQGLAKQKLIRVIANSPEAQRPVEITERGRAAIDLATASTRSGC